MAQPVPDLRAISDELTGLAIDLERLRHDPRDPSALIVGKIDIERGMRRLARKMIGRS